MTGDLRPRHREPHVGEQATLATFADVPLRVLVRLRPERADDVEPELGRQLAQLGGGHERILHREGRSDPRRRRPGRPPLRGCPRSRARAGRGARRAARRRPEPPRRLGAQGLPSVPKPRILGADGAGVVAALGDGVDGFELGERVVVNPGIPHGDRITVIGEHTDGTYCELKAIAAAQLYPLDDALTFEQGAAFPLTFETAFRMLVTKASVQEGEWVLIWGIGGGVALAAFEISRALGARTIVTSSSPEKLERATRSGPTSSSPTRRRRRRRP